MKKIVVDANTISDLGKNIQASNIKLIDLLEKMHSISVNYDEMIESNTGELYKKTMIEEIDKEKELINSNNALLADKLLWIASMYNQTNDKIKESVDGTDVY